MSLYVLRWSRLLFALEIFIFKFHKFNQAPLLSQRCSQFLDIYQCFTQGNVRNNIPYLINILVRLCVAPWNKIPHGWLM